METDSKIHKKSRRKKLLIWLLIDLTVAIIVIVLLLYRPGRYNPVDFDSYNYDEGQVSPYLTHELSPNLYNNSQRGEPFDLVITQDGINEIVAGLGWPKYSDGVMLYAPAVLFVPGTVVLMGTADVRGVELVVTIELEPKIDDRKMLNLHVSKVKIGAVNVTPLAKMMGKKMYAERLGMVAIDTEALQTKIVGSLLNEEAFDPVFRVEDNKVRIEKITVNKEKLTARLIPAS
ncbi:MAG: hypothetical protein ACYS3S_04875 [Planctomycetota bacterium]|jgi:hypothetical protein